MTNRRTTIAGIIAGLTFIASALAEDGAWTTARILRVAVGACIAALGVVARDAAGAAPALPSAAPPETVVVPPPVTPEHSGIVPAQALVEPSASWGPRPSGT